MQVPEKNRGEEKTVEMKMNQVLRRLGLNFKVSWQPSPNKQKHGNVNLKEGIIHIFDITEREAWDTLLHEVFEIKFRRITSLYQGLVNSLIDFIERQVYSEKESFLESLPLILSEFEKKKG